jgi:hypothetical protein
LQHWILAWGQLSIDSSIADVEDAAPRECRSPAIVWHPYTCVETVFDDLDGEGRRLQVAYVVPYQQRSVQDAMKAMMRVAIEFTTNLSRRRVRPLKPGETNHHSVGKPEAFANHRVARGWP